MIYYHKLEHNNHIERMYYGGMWGREVEKLFNIYPGQTFVFSTGSDLTITVYVDDVKVESLEKVKEYLKKQEITIEKLYPEYVDWNKGILNFCCLGIKMNNITTLGHLIIKEKKKKDEK